MDASSSALPIFPCRLILVGISSPPLRLMAVHRITEVLSGSDSSFLSRQLCLASYTGKTPMEGRTIDAQNRSFLNSDHHVYFAHPTALSVLKASAVHTECVQLEENF